MFSGLDWVQNYISEFIAGAIHIPDKTTANSFHVAYSGNTWWGCNEASWIANQDNALARILATGAARFTSVTITGGTIGGSAVADVGYVSSSAADIVPLNLSCSSTGISTGSDGSLSAYVVFTWTAIASSTFDYYVIRFKKTALSSYNYITVKTNTITVEGLTPNVSYDFAIASVNKFGAQSAYSATVTQTTASDTVPPATVTAGSATGGIQYNIIEWTHSSESDLSYYNIYRNTVDNSATAVKIGSTKTNYFVDGNRTGGTPYYYWVKAVDTSGNESASFSASMTATPRNVGDTDVDEVGAGKILIDGVVYLSNWRKG